MPKVKASMADISTEYILPDPGSYRLRVKSIEEKSVKQKAPESGLEVERTTYVIKSVIVSDLDGGTDHQNKPVYDYINIHTKEGELNEISLANLKRYFEAIAPASADSDDADTDELIGGEFFAELYHDSYKRSGDKEDEKSGRSVKIKESSIAPAE